ncbi:MAG: HNH endonuclease signature motif containing protein, partial [Pseudohongiella sp.]|nr:HNH endonuclease signature motif containing protein [Pseudohongiella sp.]
VELHSIMPRLSLLKPPLNGREGSVIRGSIFDAILGGKWVTFKCNSTPIDIELEKGIEIDIDAIDFSGLVAAFQGRQVLLYIPDHGYRLDEVVAGSNEGKKFHVTDCSTLDTMRKAKRFERYFATNDLGGVFNIHGHGQFDKLRREGRAKLRVCKNCMSKLNYKGYKTHVTNRDDFVRNFAIPEFFETYSSCFSVMPKSLGITDDGAYTADWKTIADNLKSAKKYKCEECTVDLSDHKRLLHVHHINGRKADNSHANLMVLCADCHRRQPFHQHMYISHGDMQSITRLRRKDSIKPNSWDRALELADPAVYGALSLLRKKGFRVPEIGFEVQGNDSSVVSEFEAAWPSARYALIVAEEQRVDLPNWTIKTIAQLHQE